MNFTWVLNLQENKGSSAASFRGSSDKCRKATGKSAPPAPHRVERALNVLFAAQRMHMPTPGGPVIFRLPQSSLSSPDKEPFALSAAVSAVRVFPGCPALGQTFLSVLLPSGPSGWPLNGILWVHVGRCLFTGQCL